MRLIHSLSTVAALLAVACGQDQSQPQPAPSQSNPFDNPMVQRAMQDLPPEVREQAEQAQREFGQMMASLPTPGTAVQMEGLERRVFATLGGMGVVGDVIQRDWNGDGTEDVVLLKGLGVTVCSATGEVIQSQSSFAGPMLAMTPSRFVDVEGDGTLEILAGGAWIAPVQVFDADLTPRWGYAGTGEGVNGVAAADFDGDGELEFAVGFNGGGGVHLLESDGSLQWRQPDANVWDVAAIDSDGDGDVEILHSNAGGEFVLREPAKGAIMRSSSPAGYFSHFSAFEWPGRPGETSIIFGEEGRLRVLDRTGQQVLERPVPGINELAMAMATAVQLTEEGPRGWAALVDFQMMNVAILVIFDDQNREVHREVLGENASSLFALDLPGEQRQGLLVCGNRTLWLFTLGE